MRKQQSLILKIRTILIVIFINLSFSNYLSAQLQICTAKDKNYSSIAYEIAFSYDCRNLLEAKGYDKNNISWQPANLDDEGIKKGYYVLVQCVRQEYDGSKKYEKIAYGIGGSKSSYEIAENLAVKNLATNDWGWIKKNGYEVVEKNTFEIKTKNTSVIAIVVMSKDAAGNKKVKNATFQYKTLTDDEYSQLKSKFKPTNPNQEIKVSRLLVQDGKVAVVKCIKTAGNSTNETYKLVYASTGDNYNVELFPEGTTTQPNEDEKYILVGETNIELENSNDNQSVISKVKQKIRESHPKTGKRKNSGTGVRG